MKALEKKLGPLKLWQWGLIVGGTGLAYYLYHKHQQAKAEVNPEEEEKLLGALGPAGGGGGEGGGFGAGSGSSQLPVPGLEGPKGETGPQGPSGPQGVQGEAPSAGLEAKVQAIETDLKQNQPPTKSHNGAPQGMPKGWTRNAKGELYRTVTRGGGVYHEYKDRKGPSKLLKIGDLHKPRSRTKRPKPGSLHHRVNTKHVGSTHKKKYHVPR